MAKKIFLIITSRSEKTAPWTERERYVRQFAEQTEALQENLTVLYTAYQELHFLAKGDQMSIYDTRNQIDLRDVDLVHFKNWTLNAQEASLIANYLDWNGVVYFNPEAKNGLANNKIVQMFVLAHHKLPVPETFFAFRPRLTSLFKSQKLPAGFRLPLIMKANDGSKGDNNYLIRSAAEALHILDSPEATDREFIIQNFIPNDGDYRFLFIGTDNDPLVFLRRGGGDSHLNNTSKGGSANFVDIKTLSPELLLYARQAAKIFEREIGGVDILIDKKTQKPYILEVNGTPALATGYGLEEKARRFAEFLSQQLEHQEEE